MITLRYNVRWIEHTFTSRPVTQSLLSPERDAGNLTTNDYEAATNFFPGPSRRYRVVGSIAALPVTYVVRRPWWTNTRTYLFMTTASFAGLFIGHMMSISAHFSFVRSIENPAGFSMALDNIQRNIGGFSLPGPVIVRQSEKLTIDHDSESPASESSPTASHEASSNTMRTDALAPLTVSSSKWEQIRANSNVSRNSSWDAIRQSHERNHVINPGDTDNCDYETRYEDRAKEQAKFDALLEKERNIR